MSATSSHLSYEGLNESLIKAGATADAAEVHGMLCGLICVNPKQALNIWLSHVLGDQDPRHASVQETHHQLMNLKDNTLDGLTSENCDFNLLLLKDIDPLPERVECLSNWCQGFIFGISLAGIPDLTQLPSNLHEVSQDILEISNAVYDPNEVEESNEYAYFEIIEYIRIGVLVIYEELNLDDSPPVGPLLH